MPRGPRVDAPGLHHHVIARGIERRPIFGDDLDRREFHRRMSDVLPDCDVDCFAWTLMPNHVHLVLRTGCAPLAVAMARLLTGYARYFNGRWERAGHLFQNRYKSLPIVDEAHLLMCVRYVHLNPVRAGIVGEVAALARYPWTGHAVLMGARSAAFQRSEAVLAEFGRGAQARRRLAAWMAGDGEGAAAAAPLRHGAAAGAEALCLAGLEAAVCRRFGVDPRVLRGGARSSEVVTARAALAFLAEARTELGIPRLAASLGISRQGAHAAIARGRAIVAGDATLRALAGSRLRECPRQCTKLTMQERPPS